MLVVVRELAALIALGLVSSPCSSTMRPCTRVRSASSRRRASSSSNCVMSARYPRVRSASLESRARSFGETGAQFLGQLAQVALQHALRGPVASASRTRCASSGPRARSPRSRTRRAPDRPTPAVRRAAPGRRVGATVRTHPRTRCERRRELRSPRSSARARRAVRSPRCGNGSSASHRTTRNRRSPTVASA